MMTWTPDSRDMRARACGLRPISRRGRVHDRASAGFPELVDLIDERVHVHQRQVGAVAVVVSPYPPEILQGYGRVRQLGGRRVLRRAVHEGEVDVEVFVGGGGPQFRGVYSDPARSGPDPDSGLMTWRSSL